MVKTLLVIAALAGVAHAEDRAVFGYRIDGGMLPIDHRATATIAIGLSAEHTVARRVRIFGEYEWLWMFRSQTDTMPAERGDGQQARVGLRVRLASAAWHELDFFLDGELGAGFLLGSDNMTGLQALPDAFAGLRTGYDFHAPSVRQATSSTLACELLLRAVRVPDGTGVIGGLGFSWQ